ncbi:hypothetical protein OIO90_002209 [Microbotryomycetes sp. JL221]|nr:hypothetical protein OIO90_002209 [Microbotryomycetes sp. JL221]
MTVGISGASSARPTSLVPHSSKNMFDSAIGALQHVQRLQNELQNGNVRKEFDGMVHDSQEVWNDVQQGLGMIESVYDRFKTQQELLQHAPAPYHGDTNLTSNATSRRKSRSRSRSRSRAAHNTVPPTASGLTRITFFKQAVTTLVTHSTHHNLSASTTLHSSTGGYHPDTIQQHLQGSGANNVLPPPPTLAGRHVQFYKVVSLH